MERDLSQVKSGSRVEVTQLEGSTEGSLHVEEEGAWNDSEISSLLSS